MLGVDIDLSGISCGLPGGRKKSGEDAPGISILLPAGPSDCKTVVGVGARGDADL